MNGRVWLGALLLSAVALGGGRPALAARCGGDFNSFVQSISAEAVAAGVSQGVVSSALGGITQDGSVLAFDRRQRYTFNKTFEQYVSTRVGPARINGGRALLARNAALFARIEQQFGVPRQIIVAIWGLESDFGKGDMGKLPVIRTLTTLAHDCRRTDLFQGELLAALKILQRGDLPLRDLIGAYAGEIGQTQFLPSSYIKYGVDFDGDGRVDLRHSVPDVLASTANLLHSNGFKMGEPYGEGSANFDAMREWNHAVIYRKTIAYFADQLVAKFFAGDGGHASLCPPYEPVLLSKKRCPMETIGRQKIWSFLDRSADCKVTTNTRVREGAGHKVSSFLELARKIAELQFLNRDHVLLFRGQGGDHRNVKGNTSVKPTLFRPEGKGNPDRATLERRFVLLARAERALVARYQSAGFRGLDRIKRHHVLRWSILQHYEVCATPLLDVTHSIRIAASFASLSANDRAYLFVLGVPNLSGAVTASAEAGLQIVRLASVCPPSAVRPHIQEGYLLGQYPEVTDVAERENYFHYEMDFGLRLVAKFHFEPTSFWTDKDFPKVARSALYPSARDDPLYQLALDVQKELAAS